MRKLSKIILFAALAMTCSAAAACTVNNNDPAEPPAHTHSYGEWTEIENTCISHYRSRTCSVCGGEEIEKLDPKGHRFGNWEDIVDTCTEHIEMRTCNDCDLILYRPALLKKEHTWSDWEDIVNDCERHVELRVCTECGHKSTQEFKKDGHVFGEWQDVVKTCKEWLQFAECETCGLITTRELEPEGHSIVGWRCIDCGILGYDGEDLSYLDKYNGSYGYDYFRNNNYLAECALYKRIDEQVKVFHVNDVDAISESDGSYIVSGVEYSDLGLNSSRAVSVWKTYKDDNPLFYWLSNDTSTDKNKIYLQTTSEYAESSARREANSLVYSKVEEYLGALSDSDNTYRTALAFHDLIINTIDYAYDDGGNPSQAVWAHNIMGLFQERGGVCETYARAYQLLLNVSGIENIFVTGTANGEAHAWNLLKLDNGGWYWCDVTWDDTPGLGVGISYNYFLVNDTQTVNRKDGGIETAERTFLDEHKCESPSDVAEKFLYSLPERAEEKYSDEAAVDLRDSFTLNGLTYCVNGYNTVQLTKTILGEELNIPETVRYKGITYTVISIGEAVDGIFKINADSYLFHTGVRTVNIPKTVAYIWGGAFDNPTIGQINVDSFNEKFCSLDGVLFTNSMKTLVAYPANRNVSEYTVPDAVERIESNTFRNCSNLSKLNVTANFRYFVAGDGWNYDGDVKSSSLNGLSVADFIWYAVIAGMKYGDVAPRICVDDNNPYYFADETGIYNKDKTQIQGYFDKKVESITVPETLIYGVEKIGLYNFENLKRITVAAENTAYADVNGILYNKEKTEIFVVPRSISGSHTVADGVTEINGEFRRSAITEITIHSNVTQIDVYAFSYCTSLTRINYSGTVTEWKRLVEGKDVFYRTGDVYIYCSNGTLNKNGVTV